MRDLHCHILPGVDDGARNLDMSLQMIVAAKEAGVTSIVCTPHCRSPYFDYDGMWDAFDLLSSNTDMPLTMGFEVNYTKLIDLGAERWADYLAYDGSTEFLLELNSRCTASDFEDYERVIFDLQGMGYTVIIAHPERYQAIQKDISLAENLVRMGCKLQASADFIRGGRLGKEKKPARALFEKNLYTYIASDAHRPEHYKDLARALKEYHPLSPDGLA